MLGKIKKDIKSLRGKTVSVFGQPCKIDSDCNKYTIDALNVIDALKPYEVNTRDASLFIDRLIAKRLIDSDCKSDNTYNYSAPISNDIYYHIYKKKQNDGIYVVLAFHRYGDVRCNYTDEAVLMFSCLDEFYYILNDCSIYTSIDVDGITYEVNIDFFCDPLSIYDESGAFICNTYGYDDNDIINDIKEAVKNV